MTTKTPYKTFVVFDDSCRITTAKSDSIEDIAAALVEYYSDLYVDVPQDLDVDVREDFLDLQILRVTEETKPSPKTLDQIATVIERVVAEQEKAFEAEQQARDDKYAYDEYLRLKARFEKKE